MTVSPYLQFNGNCSDAISFYEKAFEVKAEIYKKEKNFVVHAELNLGGGYVCLSDTPAGEEKSTFGNGGISISIELDNELAVKTVFNKMKVGGKVWESPAKTEWCDCFCTFQDKFGVNWSLMTGEKTTCVACGMPMKKKAEFAMGDTNKNYCCHCARPDGSMKSYDEVFKGGVQWAMGEFKISEAEAKKMIEQNMKKQPAWKNKK